MSERQVRVFKVAGILVETSRTAKLFTDGLNRGSATVRKIKFDRIGFLVLSERKANSDQFESVSVSAKPAGRSVWWLIENGIAYW